MEFENVELRFERGRIKSLFDVELMSLRIFLFDRVKIL